MEENIDEKDENKEEDEQKSLIDEDDFDKKSILFMDYRYVSIGSIKLPLSISLFVELVLFLKFIKVSIVLLKQTEMDLRSNFEVSWIDGPGTSFRHTH